MDKLPYREFIAMMQERTREADVPYSGSFELTPLCNFARFCLNIYKKVRGCAL